MCIVVQDLGLAVVVSHAVLSSQRAVVEVAVVMMIVVTVVQHVMISETIKKGRSLVLVVMIATVLKVQLKNLELEVVLTVANDHVVSHPLISDDL